MIGRSMSQGQGGQRLVEGRLSPGGVVLSWIWGLAFVFLVGSWADNAKAAPPGARPQSILQAVDISPLAGNRLQLRFKLSERVEAPPSSFTINEPARIVLDFLDTRNGLASRQQPINVGVAEKISVLEGADRTRASLNLSRLVPYKVEVRGDSVVLTLESAGTVSRKTPAPTPSGAVAASAPKRSEAPAFEGPRSVSDVNFKRGPAGQGVITVKLSSASTAVDVRQEGNQIVADFQNAKLPRGQQRRLDVTDFATPVTTIEALNRGDNARLSIQPIPPFEYLAYQADDLYVIEVRPPQRDTEEEKRAAELDPSKKKYQGDLLSLNFQDIEVRAILQILADFTGLNIVVSDTVKGNLTLRLQNVPWDQALDIIMRTKGLAMRQNGNVIFIAPTEEIAAREKLDLESRKTVEELIPLHTEIIQVNYAKAADMAKLLQSGDEKKGSILSPRGTVEMDERTNSLIVKDVPDKLGEIRNLISKLDIPVRQVLIDSRVVIANDDFAKDIGTRFGISGVSTTGDGRVNTVSGNLESTGTMIDSAVGNLISTGQPFPVAVPSLPDRLGVNLAAPGPSIAFAILGADYLVDLELSALQTEGKGELVSNPRVATADGKEAKILQGQTVETIIRGADQDAVLTTNAFLELTVTPHITPDDRITMDLLVTKNDVNQSTDTKTITDKREVKTQVLVNNGETVVLGGVVEHNKTESKSQVPLLGDIPLLGYLFQRNTNDATKRELLIFVTPQILKEGAVE